MMDRIIFFQLVAGTKPINFYTGGAVVFDLGVRQDEPELPSEP